MIFRVCVQIYTLSHIIYENRLSINIYMKDQEDKILKRIRYYQASVDDFETFWNKKIAEGESEECPERKEIKKKNEEMNYDYTIRPVE